MHTHAQQFGTKKIYESVVWQVGSSVGSLGVVGKAAFFFAVIRMQLCCKRTSYFFFFLLLLLHLMALNLPLTHPTHRGSVCSDTSSPYTDDILSSPSLFFLLLLLSTNGSIIRLWRSSLCMIPI